jgi:hypothetical protein
MSRVYSSFDLVRENMIMRGTGGRSEENREAGFTPAFIDIDTGLVYRSCTASGSPASIHLLDGLPEHLIVARNTSGRVVAVKNSVVAGFTRDGEFYTREQAADALSGCRPDN